MTAAPHRRTWTVVHPSADDSPATTSASVLVDWLSTEAGSTVHTVLWLPGWTSTTPFDVGFLHDVAADHRAALPRLLRHLGGARPADILTARAVRRTLATVPSHGGLYLNGAATAVALRYLPAGERTVVTHLHPSDVDAVAQLPPDRVQQLIDATDLWLSTDETTRSWAVETFGVEAEEIHLVGPLVDLARWDERHRAADPDELHLAVLGGSWFRSDHTGRLVQALLARRPTLDLHLVWAEVEQEEHLAPLRHDLRTLGVLDRFLMPATHAEVTDQLAAAQVLAVTAPDDDLAWLPRQATRDGLPMVCFDTHRAAGDVGTVVDGVVVPYLDVVGMADAILDLGDQRRLGIDGRRAELADRDVQAVGPWLVEQVEELRR